jgi:membrane-bound lytic murein transglycosylase MltF
MTYELIKAFEKSLNESLGNTVVTVHVIAIPVARDQLIPRLLDGRGDIAAAQLTVTPERKKQVDFSEPVATGVTEVLVTGPDTPPVASLDELSGRELYVRPSSSYAEHLRALNARFESEGKAPVKIVPADETLETGDIPEMVSAGLVPATVADKRFLSMLELFRKYGERYGLATCSWQPRSTSPTSRSWRATSTPGSSTTAG